MVSSCVPPSGSRTVTNAVKSRDWANAAASAANSDSNASSVMENGTSDDGRNQAPFSNVS